MFADGSSPVKRDAPYFSSCAIEVQRTKHAVIALLVAALITCITLLIVGAKFSPRPFHFMAQQIKDYYLYYAIGLGIAVAGAMAYIFIPRTPLPTPDLPDRASASSAWGL